MAIHSFQGPVTGPLQVPHNVAWKPPAWTMALWVKSFIDSFRAGIFSTSLVGNGTTAGVCWETDYRGLYVNFLSNQESIANLADGNWCHAAVAFDSTDARFYVNGASSSAPWTGLGIMAWDTNPLTLAAAGVGELLICLPKIYNRKLSAAEVATLASGGEVTSGLVARWPGNEGTGQTIADNVGGFNATTTGVITWSNDIPSQLGGSPPSSGRAGFSTLLIRGRR